MPDKAISKVRRLIFLALALIIVVPAICFTLWRLRLSHEVNYRLAAIRSAGIPINHAETDKWYAAVPDEQNAALVITQALGLVCTYSDARAKEMGRLKPPMRTNLLTAADKILFSGYVDMNRPALAKAREAFALPQSRYPIDLSFGAETPMPHLSQIKALAMIASFEAILAGESHRPGDSMDGLTTILGLGRTLESEPILISQLMRMSIMNIAVRTLEYRLNTEGMSETELSQLARGFAARETTNQVARALIGERAMTIPYFRMSVGEIQRQTAEDEEGSARKTSRVVTGPRPLLVTLSGFFERDQLFFLRVMETNIALAQLPPPRCLASQQVLENASAEAESHYYLLSAMTLPALSRVVREVKATAELRLATTAIAVERFRLEHGRLPHNLGELVPQFLRTTPADPFDGSPLRYRRLEKGYTLYSVDSDGHDDGGREKPERKKSTDKTSYDVTFIVER